MSTKTKILYALVSSLFVSNASFADDGKFDAFVSVDAARSNYSSDISRSVNDNVYGLRATAAYQANNNYGMQIDTVYNKYQIRSNDVSNIDFAGHLFYRNEQFLIGGFAQYRKPDISIGGLDPSANLIANIFSDLLVSEQVFWGAEGQAFFGDLTVNGQLAKQEFVNQKDFSGDQLLKDGYVANIGAKYFIKDNWKVDFSYTYNKTDMINASLKYKTLALGTEYRFDDSPLSVFAQYNRNEMNVFDFDTNSFLVGFKMNVGSETLKGRDRSGASLNPITQAPAGAVILGNMFDDSLVE